MVFHYKLVEITLHISLHISFNLEYEVPIFGKQLQSLYLFTLQNAVHNYKVSVWLAQSNC